MNDAQGKPDMTQEQVIALWERLDKEFLDKMRASGRTVTVREASDREPYVVTFPPARAPKATPKKKP